MILYKEIKLTRLSLRDAKRPENAHIAEATMGQLRR